VVLGLIIVAVEPIVSAIWWGERQMHLSLLFLHRQGLARISHGPVRNAYGVPIRHWRIGASREGFRPGKLLSKQLPTGDLLTS